MTDIINLVSNMNHIHWYIVGLALISIEIIIFTNYVMLWLGLSAIIVGSVLFFLPISWQTQWFVFSAAALAIALSWWFFQSNKDQESNKTRHINTRKKKMLEDEIIINQDCEKGFNQVQIGETFWTINTSQALTKGDKIKVTKMDGVILIVEKVN